MRLIIKGFLAASMLVASAVPFTASAAEFDRKAADSAIERYCAGKTTADCKSWRKGHARWSAGDYRRWYLRELEDKSNADIAAAFGDTKTGAAASAQ